MTLTIGTKKDDKSPVTTIKWEETVRIPAATLLVGIRLPFINAICNALHNNLMLTSDTLTNIVVSHLIDIEVSDVGFIRRLNFLLIKIENTYNEIASYLNRNVLCENIKDIQDSQKQLKHTFDRIWNVMTELNTTEHVKEGDHGIYRE